MVYSGTLLCMPHRKPLAIELIHHPHNGGYFARVPDVPAFGEGFTAKAAIEDLKEALRRYAECYGLEDLQSRIQTGPDIRFVDWELSELARA